MTERGRRPARVSERSTVRIPRNPLERPVDRAHARAHRLVATMVLLALPFVLVAGVAFFRDQQSVAANIAATTESVQATTTVDAQDGAATSAEFAASTPVVPVDATWTVRGVEYSGTVPAAASSKAGTTVAITVDDEGRRVPPPPTGFDVALAAVFGTGCLIGLVVLSAVFARAAATRHYDKVRDRQWDDAIARMLG